MPQMESIFSQGGIISQAVHNYEERYSQIIMAKAIESGIEKRKQLIVEAGTGVGKSLAYLVPFIIWARENGKRVIVSTYTKTLQHQLVEKDIPFLKKVLDNRLRYALCVGGQNYLCLRRFDQVISNDLYETREEARQIKRIIKWEKKTTTGLRSELDFEPLPSLWSKISRENDLCFGKKCPYVSCCYYIKARNIQKDAHLLIVNHHLYFANLVSGEKVLPPYHAVVFDEAHNLEDVAVNYLGIEVANTRIKHLTDTLYNPKTGKGLLPRLRENRDIEDVKQSVDDVRLASEYFFLEILQKFECKKFPWRLREPYWIKNNLSVPLKRLELNLRKLRDREPREEEKLELTAFIGRINELSNQLDIVVELSEPEYVYWINVEKKMTYPRISLNASAINIADFLENLIFKRISPIVLTSATLSTDGTFEYIQERLGIKSAELSILDSPFDYLHNALIYIARDLPDPNRDMESFHQKSLARIIELLSLTKGGTFILFTSFRFLEEISEALKREVYEYTLLKQGDKPQYQLIEDFKKMQNAVLLGTNTFWQGVDIPGKALESVIITKLPFAVPDDPITEARMELMEAKNINPFVYYQVPQAIIWLKQGFGRLIRSSRDRGMVAILDPRIITRSYGRRFIKSLPPCKITYTLREVKEFVEEFKRKPY